MVIEFDTIRDMMYAQLLYDLHQAEEKCKLFHIKYNLDYEQFEKKIQDSERESFEEWDDYMEWKAFQHVITKLETERKELDLGHIRVPSSK